MKCGTTSLHNYLADHPEASMSEPKEPAFFVSELNWSKGFEWYLSLFPQRQKATVVGESSTSYTMLPTFKGVPERIHAFNPDARLIYLMRDPLDRIVSHYWHNVRDLQSEAERRDIFSAVNRDRRYIAYSDYAMQLEPYHALFGPEQVYHLTLESLAADPESTVKSICRWLRLRQHEPDQRYERRWNTRPLKVRKARGRGYLNRVRYSRLWDRLSPVAPRWIKALGNRLAEESVRPDEEEVRRVLDDLRPFFLERTEVLTGLLGREFPEWRTLHDTPAGPEAQIAEESLMPGRGITGPGE